MVERKIDIELARAEIIEISLKRLVVVFIQQLRSEIGEYDRLAGWIKKGLLLGRLMKYCGCN